VTLDVPPAEAALSDGSETATKLFYRKQDSSSTSGSKFTSAINTSSHKRRMTTTALATVGASRAFLSIIDTKYGIVEDESLSAKKS